MQRAQQPRASRQRACRELAAVQGGLIRKDQVIELGLSPGAIRWQLRSGNWLHVTRGVYRVFEPRDRRDLLAGAVAALPDAVVSHESAAELHGMSTISARRPSVSVHARTTHRFPGVSVHRTLDLAPQHIERRHGLQVTTLSRTVVDIAGVCSDAQLARVVDDLLVSSRLRLDQLADTVGEVARPGKRGSAALRRLLEERAAPGDATATPLERHGLKTLRHGGLPEPVVQCLVPWDLDRRFDAAYPDHRLAIEWDSRRWHTRQADFQSDRERDRGAAVHGWTVLRFTWHDVRDHPERVVREVAAVLELRATA
ncbi:MAG: type IV toxin-antitoxin system AbiEi family antitoxin domain-containing protein [Acidimicrobiales bacterium]